MVINGNVHRENIVMNSELDTTKISEGEGEDHDDVPGERAKLNVSGVSYEIKWKTLRKFPTTRLGRLALIIKDDAMSHLHVCATFINSLNSWDI